MSLEKCILFRSFDGKVATYHAPNNFSIDANNYQITAHSIFYQLEPLLHYLLLQQKLQYIPNWTSAPYTDVIATQTPVTNIRTVIWPFAFN